MNLKSVIRTVPDFPKPGILFFDITTLLKDPAAFGETIERMCEPYKEQNVKYIIGIESRGFIFGSAMAANLNTGLIPIRKPGKLPAETISESYALEYGTDTIEIHQDALEPGDRVVLVDDLLATGGTMSAAVKLVQKAKAGLLGASFLMELSFLKGREKLTDIPLHVLLSYD